MSIISCDSVTKSFGAVKAVDALTFSVNSSGITALLGSNGAGKTTTIDMLTGVRRPTTGTVRVFGADPANAKTRARIGCVPQQGGVPDNLRVREILEFVAQQYPEPLPVTEILSDFDLAKLGNRQAGGFSGGELRLLTLALAFVGRPNLVFLDEPTNGLDLEARRMVWDYVRDYAARGGSVLLTTHHMEEAEALASRILVMNGGRIIRDGSPREIREVGSARRLAYAGDPFDPAAFGLQATVTHADGRVAVSTHDIDGAVRALVNSGVTFRELAIEDQTLEDAVLALLEEYA